MIIHEGQIFKADFFSVLALLVAWLRVFRWSFGNGIGS
jgi:hypothetical protein